MRSGAFYDNFFFGHSIKIRGRMCRLGRNQTHPPYSPLAAWPKAAKRARAHCSVHEQVYAKKPLKQNKRGRAAHDISSLRLIFFCPTPPGIVRIAPNARRYTTPLAPVLQSHRATVLLFQNPSLLQHPSFACAFE